MERQSSSSSRGQNSIGCMSAIFHLLSKRQNRTKFLTCGKDKKQKGEAQSPIEAHWQRLKAENFKRNPAMAVETPWHGLAERLMGLELDLPDLTPEPTADKRNKLLGALDKCDEELKALQRIIQVVKTSVSIGDNNERLGRNLQQQKKQLLKKKPGEEDSTRSTPTCFFDRFTKKSVADAKSNKHHQGVYEVSALWRSNAMVRSVQEVCNDIAWGERREIGRIGLALQDHIFRDLIDEIVKEIGCSCYSTFSLPFQSCKRGLSF